MSLLHFIKLLFKNLKLLILVPLLMAASVYYFTRNEVKVYSSESVIYTGIASGYTLNGSNKADYFSTSNAFDNLLSIINSRETKQEVALKLIAEHLYMKKYDQAQLSWNAYQSLQQVISDTLKKKLVKNTMDETLAAIDAYMQASENNTIYNLLNSDNPFYSLNALKNITALRISSSDLVKIAYYTQDAAICKHTLELLEQTFMRKHKLLREGQTESVITYFESETNKAFSNLDSAEEIFLDFNKKNDIINYYEQTKAVAGERENLYALNHSLEMDRTAEGSALNKINTNLEGRAQAALYGTKIIDQREELSKIYNSLAVYEALGQNNGGGTKIITDSLKQTAAALEKRMHTTVDELYVQNTTPGGIPSKDMLDEWLKTTISYEQSKARLSVMDKRKKEFQEEYSKFAPLGATLKKIDRQISVAEQAYLEMLHGLNLARLTQQNNELTSKLTVVDPPYLPLKANPSTRTVMIAVAFMAGFVIVLAGLLARFLIDKSLQEPVRASKKIGIPLLGIYPLLNESKYLLDKAGMRLLQQLLASVNANQKPLTIGFISIENKEGKTTLIKDLQKGIEQTGRTTVYTKWDSSSIVEADKINFIEFTALDQYVYTATDMPPLDHVFIVCRANRIWTKIDKELLSNFIRVTQTSPKTILNGVDIDFAEEYIGEVPKKRTVIRSFIKHLVKFQFGNRKAISKKKANSNGF